MCGIFAILNSNNCNEIELRRELIQCSSKLRHRGPDWSGYKVIHVDSNTNTSSDDIIDLELGTTTTNSNTNTSSTNTNSTTSNTSTVLHGIAHERLAIMDPESGSQPLMNHNETIIVAANGEIYNYKEIYDSLTIPYTPLTGSDCEVLIPLYEQYILKKYMKKDNTNTTSNTEEDDNVEDPFVTMIQQLRGMFSFILYDVINDLYCIVRDHIGITPLYIGYNTMNGSIYIGSEMKSIHNSCIKYMNFPPGHYYSNYGGNNTKSKNKLNIKLTKNMKKNDFVRWYQPSFAPHMIPGEVKLPTQKYQADTLRHAFERAVVRRMMSDVPWGVLLSGGLDSSLVASICARHISRRSTKFPKLHSFTIGLQNSPDILAAQKVADYLGTIHHSYTYTIQEGADAIRDVIKTLETYDLTTIRASTPMYLMSRKIKAMGIKMVLSGEGADEVFGGYLYFHKCPNAQEFMDETIDKLSRLHMYDCLRCNKAMSAWGVEPRVPFLDADFLEIAMNLDPNEKMIHVDPKLPKDQQRIEKWVLRKAFDTPDDPYLPDDILWRQKEQFSDGVGYGWVDHLKHIAEQEISVHMFENAKNRFPYNTPMSKEGYRYRMIFEEYYPGESAERTVPGGKTIACSTERAMKWDTSFESRADPSGRSAGVHDAAYDDTTFNSIQQGLSSDEPVTKKSKS